MNVTAMLRDDPVPEACLQAADTGDKSVPQGARLWGFVRRTANERDDSAALRENDVGLWLDEERCRFMVAAGKAVKDDLAPLEFVQFIRELKHSHSQTLFKVGDSFQRSPTRATPVWTRPVAALIPFPTRLQLLVKQAPQRGRSADIAALYPPPRRAASRRIGNAAAARFS
jgi:hypothetical protein